MKVNLTIGVPDWLDRICAWPAMWYRRRKFGYDFRRIDLGEGEFTIVEPEDYYRLANFKWYVRGNGINFYAVCSIKTGPKKTKLVCMNREIMNAPKGLFVDHKNCDSLDNRRDNLRLATRVQNACNRQWNKSRTSSRYRGIALIKRSGRWSAQISHEGERIWLGTFDNEVNAARVYDEAAKKYHGEFARLNFP
jgi:hypothetical protein